eukprot:UN05077
MLYDRVDAVWQGFVMLGALLFAAAWILPTLLAISLTLIDRLLPSEKLIARWMVSDGWSQLPT